MNTFATSETTNAGVDYTSKGPCKQEICEVSGSPMLYAQDSIYPANQVLSTLEAFGDDDPIPLEEQPGPDDPPLNLPSTVKETDWAINPFQVSCGLWTRDIQA